jgi:zinc D-Ala-D-Ala carboxypeptidase
MKKIIYFAVIFGIILGISLSYYINESKIIKVINKYETIGYSKDEIELIFELNETSKLLIENNDYILYLKDLLIHPYFIENKLNEYLEFHEDDINKTVEYVNTNRNKTFYENPISSNLNDGYLLLVNKYYNLNENYQPDDLEKVDIGYGYLRKVANDALNEMSDAAKEDNITLYVTSAFRSFETQYNLYENYAKRDGFAKADTYSARPGHSEHQTGLAVDLVKKGSTLSNFHLTEDFEWLKENSYKYGFIIRYPLGKEDITGYIYEPWHYRYVGVEVASYIYENKITYDEYYTYYLEGLNEENQ